MASSLRVTVTTGALFSSDTLPPMASFTEHTMCLDPLLAGRVAQLQAVESRGGNCGSTFAAEESVFDDFVLTTDASCPTN